MKINLRLSAAGFKPLINKENSKCENVKRMIPLVFGQRLFDDAERLKFYSVVGNCSFGGGFFSQTGSFMPLSGRRTLQTQYLNYRGFNDKINITFL